MNSLYDLRYKMSTRDASPDIQEIPSMPQVDDTLEGPADVPSMRKELSELHEKVDDLLRMMRAITAKQSSCNGVTLHPLLPGI